MIQSNAYDLFNYIEESMSAIGEYDVETIKQAFHKLKNSALPLLPCDSDIRNCSWENTEYVSVAEKSLSRLQKELLRYCLGVIETYPNGLIKTINKAVILDYLHEDEDIWLLLDELYKFFDEGLISNPKLLWECGNLCYKLNRYDQSIEYYSEFILLSKQTTNWKNNNSLYNIIGQACIKIGYCYEFKHEFVNALYVYGLIKKRVEPFIESAVDDDVKVFISKLIADISYDSLSKENIYDIEHGLGHFYNEIVLFPENEAFNRKVKSIKPEYLYKANHILYSIACESGRYYSCLGTNHSEYNEFLEAVQIIDFAIEAGIFNWNKTNIQNQHLIQRLNFYKAHAYMYCGLFSKAHECFDSFKSYCSEYADKDGFAHLAIYQAYLMMLEKGLNKLTYDEINSALKELNEYKPSLYSNIQMIDERNMLIHILNSLLLMNMLVGDNEIESGLSQMVNPIDELPVELYNTIMSMEKNSGKKMFQELGGSKKDNSIDSGLYKINYLGLNILWIGQLPVTKKYSVAQITEQSFLNIMNDAVVVINQNISENPLSNSISHQLGRCKKVLVTSDYSVVTTNSLPELKFIPYNKDSIIKLAYILEAYNRVCHEFLEQKPFLGMSPTQITQGYVYRPRVYKGLFSNKDEEFYDDTFSDIIRNSNDIFDSHTKLLYTINNPKKALAFIDNLNNNISSKELSACISGFIYQPGLANGVSQQSNTWIYKFFGTEIIIDNDRDTNKFYKRYRESVRTKIPYNNKTYSEFPDFETKKTKIPFTKCLDCNKKTRMIKGYYSSCCENDLDWDATISFFKKEILQNILYVDYSVANLKQIICCHTEAGTRESSGYLFIALTKNLTDLEVNGILKEVMLAFCKSHFECEDDDKQQVEEQSSAILQNPRYNPVNSTEKHILQGLERMKI